MDAASRAGWSSCGGQPLAEAHDALLLDLDGVIYVGEHAVDGVPAVLDRLRGHVGVAFVTNNASRTPEQVAAHLRELGIHAEPTDVVTSAQTAAALLADELAPGTPVLCIGAEGLSTALSDAGLVPVTSMDQGPRALVQGFSPNLNWAMLFEATLAVRAGLPWVATNVDRTLPTPRGPAPGNGAFVELVRQVTDGAPRVAGKPARAIMDAAVARTGGRRALVVGDRLDTDLAAARAASLPGMLVLTGVTGVNELIRAEPAERPSFVAADLSGVLDEHRAPTRSGQTWTGGHLSDVRAAWVDGHRGPRLRITAAESVPENAGDEARTTVEVLRVAAAAVWALADSGAEPPYEQVLGELRPWTAGQGCDE